MNVSIGFCITMISLHLIFPLLGIENHSGKNSIITGYLTVLSIIRNYVIRRFFVRIRKRRE
ncbi:DUF7220 family protein [Aquimarina hainanensis]